MEGENKQKTVAIVGLGYVGLPLALLADQKGYRVFGIDVSAEKVGMINDRKSPFVDEKIERELKTTRMTATTELRVVKDADVIVICVPTPVYENYLPNLEPVQNACKSIAPFLHKGQLVILESTVNPGVSEGVVLPILEKISGMKGGVDFYLAHCPERINPGDKQWDVHNIPRVVGSLDRVGLEKAVAFYSSIVDGAIRPMNSLKEAEAVKVVENSFRDINIAFVNELARSFAKLGIDVVNVIDGAATKPFAFMAHYPGCGVGGHCIPVDPYYLIEYAKDHGFNHDFLSLARRINNDMPAFTAEQVLEGLNAKRVALNGARVAVLGLSYKADIDDCRESPSFKIIEKLKAYGADIAAFDPFVPAQSNASSLDEAVRGAKAVLIATCHTIFKQEITPEYLAERGVLVLVDGRNCLPKEDFQKAGIEYRGIGR